MNCLDVMKQALEALERSRGFVWAASYTKFAQGWAEQLNVIDAAITALRLAIEEAEKYDQTSLALCDKCGWKTLIPGDCCLNCVRQAERQEPVAWEWRYDSCGHAVVNRLVVTDTPEPTLFLKNVFARGPFPLYTAPPQRQPLPEIAEALRRHGLTLVQTAKGYEVLRLGEITAHGIGGEE